MGVITKIERIKRVQGLLNTLLSFLFFFSVVYTIPERVDITLISSSRIDLILFLISISLFVTNL